MNITINKDFSNREYVRYENRAFGRAMFSIGINGNYTNNQKMEIGDSIKSFLLNSKKLDVMDIMKTAQNIRHLLGLIESAFMTKHIKVKRIREKKIKIKVGKKVTDIAIDRFYLI